MLQCVGSILVFHGMYGQGSHEGLDVWYSVFTINYSPCTEHFARACKVCLFCFLKIHSFTVIRDPRLFSLKISWMKQVLECQFMTRIAMKMGKDCETEECQGEGGPSLGSVQLQEDNSPSALLTRGWFTCRFWFRSQSCSSSPTCGLPAVSQQ